MSITLVAFISCIFLSCKDRDVKKELVSTEFPIAVGNWWTYEMKSKDNSISEVKFEITKKLDTAFYTNFYIDGILADSGLFSISDSACDYKGLGKKVICPDFKLKFPVYEGKTWEVLGAFDQAEVTTYSRSIELEDIKYKSVFDIERSFGMVNVFLFHTMKISPNIGIVQMVVAGTLYGPHKIDSLKLIDYHLN